MRSNKKRAALLLAFVFTAAFLTSCSLVEPAPVETPAPAETLAPTETPVITLAEFTTTDLDGNEVTNAVFENAKLTFVNIWGTFCPPCLAEMPDLGKLAKSYADKDVQIIGVLVDASEETPDELALAKEIREETGADYLHLLNSESVSYAMLYGVKSIPTSFFVNERGEVVSRLYVGARSEADWASIFEKILEEQP